jgi:ribosomal protein S27AE
MRTIPARNGLSVEVLIMAKLKDNVSTPCPHCGHNRQLFRHAKTWRHWCGFCGIWWRYQKDPRKPGQSTPDYKAQL